MSSRQGPESESDPVVLHPVLRRLTTRPGASGATNGAHMKRSFDVTVIGAGVTGCALARDLSRFECDVALLEAQSDLGNESSKGNSAILCSGFDTPEGSLERQLVVRGSQRYHVEAAELGLPTERTGSLTVGFTDAEVENLQAQASAARGGGFESVTYLSADEAYARAPNIGAGVLGALWSPDEAIADPFSTPYAYALDAVTNGVTYLPGCPVTGVSRDGYAWHLDTPEGRIRSGIVINCGGLRADTVEALAGYRDFSMKPVRGQYIVFDKLARPMLDTIVSPAPTPASRGILIVPTIFGNVLVGPTADPVTDRDDRRVTGDGIERLWETATRMLPGLTDHMVTTTFAGMRPGTDPSGYQIIPRLEDRWVTVAGIRSTGLSAALGVAEYVCDQIVPALINPALKSTREAVQVPDLSHRAERPWQDPYADSDGCEIVCHCERITLAEVRACLGTRIPPRSIKALRRRTRVMFGRCQGFFCGARVESLYRAARDVNS